MVTLGEYIRSLEAKIEQSKLRLKSLEDGSLIVGSCSNGDKTQDWIKRRSHGSNWSISSLPLVGAVQLRPHRPTPSKKHVAS